jgi:putative endonuclease
VGSNFTGEFASSTKNRPSRNDRPTRLLYSVLMEGFYVYVMTNQTNTTLYTGVCKHLKKRVFEHRGSKEGFTARYNINKLVYFQGFDSIDDAILEEKRIKGGSRRKKILLVERDNPSWQDLTDSLKQ